MTRLAFRLSISDLAAIDAEVARLHKIHPGSEATRSSVARAALTAGLPLLSQGAQ